MKNPNTFLVIILLCIFCNILFAGSIEKATLYYEHGLTDDAKKELIDVILGKSSQSSKAEANYLLGSIAFNERRVSVALKTWKILVKDYPNSKEANLVKDKISELAEIVGESAEESIKNAVAQSYLRHADFWSEDKNRMFMIDASWIPKVEASIKCMIRLYLNFQNQQLLNEHIKENYELFLDGKNQGGMANHMVLRKISQSTFHY